MADSQTAETGWPVLRARTGTQVFSVLRPFQSFPFLLAPREALLLPAGADMNPPWAGSTMAASILRLWGVICRRDTGSLGCSPLSGDAPHAALCRHFLCWIKCPCICLLWGWRWLERGLLVDHTAASVEWRLLTYFDPCYLLFSYPGAHSLPGADT